VSLKQSIINDINILHSVGMKKKMKE